MKKITLLILLSLSCTVQADPGIFPDITYAFGANAGTGISLKVLSNNKEERAVAAAGVSFYPLNTTQKFGADLGVGYLGNDIAATIGWDFLQKGVQIGLGYVNSKDDNNKSAPPAPPAAAPPPPPPITNA